MENMKKPKKTIFLAKILISTKLPNPIRKTQVSKLVFRTIPCLKFWAQGSPYVITPLLLPQTNRKGKVKFMQHYWNDLVSSYHL